MNTQEILSDQVIRVKRGRLNGLGFEPAFNSYFDFYASSKYIDPPLLQLEDIAFHLFLRKNLNDKNPAWQMPSIRQIRRKFRIGHHKLDAMLGRLGRAHLLKKESGLRKGEYGRNSRNDYILSDPLQALDEFLAVASEGVFGASLKGEWLCPQNEDTGVPETRTPDDPEMRTDQQTFLKTEDESLWEAVLESLRASTPAQTFMAFLTDTSLSLTDGVATVYTPRTHAVEWLDRQMGGKIKRALNVELRCRDREAAVTDVVVSCRHE